MTMTVGSLFAGIGGFDLGLERAGMVVRWQVERDPFCQRVLAKHWPEVPRYDDVRDCGSHNLAPVDLVCGGFPCQPFSNAGQRRGQGDDRYLWPEMRRVIAELRPRWVLGENVPGIISLALDEVLFDLEGAGYTAWAVTVPAAAVDAPHRRERVWIVGHDNSNGARCGQQGFTQHDGAEIPGAADGEAQRSHTDRLCDAVPNSQGVGCNWGGAVLRQAAEQAGRPGSERATWAPEPRVGRVAHGVPDRVDRLRALGNAVVPQVVEELGRMILDVEAADARA